MDGIRQDTLVPEKIDLRSLFERYEASVRMDIIGRLPSNAFFSLLAELGLKLQESQRAYVQKHFGDYQQNIDYLRFEKAVDVFIPAYHHEIEEQGPGRKLQQPYRRVVKVLNEDISDAAWNEIGQRHPHVARQTSLYAVPPDLIKQDLERCCKPVAWISMQQTEDDTVEIDSTEGEGQKMKLAEKGGEVEGPATAMALDSKGNLYVGTLTGQLKMINVDTRKNIASTTIFPDFVGGIGGLALASRSSSTTISSAASSPLHQGCQDVVAADNNAVCLIAVFINAPPAPPPLPPAAGDDLKETEPTPTPVTTPAAGGGERRASGGKDKDTTKRASSATERKGSSVFKTSIAKPVTPATATAAGTAVEPSPNDSSATSPKSRIALLRASGQSIRGFAKLELDVLVEKLILSKDGTFLCVISQEGEVSVHKVPPASNELNAKGLFKPIHMKKISEEMSAGGKDGPAYQIPHDYIDMPPAFWRPELPQSHAPSFIGVHFLDCLEDKSWIKTLTTTGLILCRDRQLQQYDFVTISKTVIPAGASSTIVTQQDAKQQKTVAASANKSPAATAAPLEIQTHLAQAHELAVELVKEWTMLDVIAASAIDESTYLLALGLQSGTCLLWDLQLGGLRCVLGREGGPIASLALVRAKYVVTGSMNGRLHVYDLRPEPISSRGVEESDFMKKAYNLPTPKLLISRHDFLTPILSIKAFDDVPVCVVLDATDQFAFIDLKNGPFGHVSKTEDSASPLIRANDTFNLYYPKFSSKTRSIDDQQAFAVVGGDNLIIAYRVSALPTSFPDQDGFLERIKDAPSSQLALFKSAQCIRELCPAIGSLNLFENQQVRRLFALMPPEARRQQNAPDEYKPHLHPEMAQTMTDDLDARPAAATLSRSRPASSNELTSRHNGSTNSMLPVSPTSSKSSSDLHRVPSRAKSASSTHSLSPNNQNLRFDVKNNERSDPTDMLIRENLALAFVDTDSSLCAGIAACRYSDPAEAIQSHRKTSEPNRAHRDLQIKKFLKDLLASFH